MKKRPERIVYLNGRFLSVSAARISAEDRGLLYGDGLFETVRIYRGRPFALDEHLLRLRRAGDRVRLRIPGGSAWWAATIAELLRRNRLDGEDAAVRLTVTRGVGGKGILPPRQARPTILLSTRPIPRRLREWQRSGVRVVLLPFHPGSDGYLRGVKTTDYLTAILGKAMARERGAFEGIYSTADGSILEGTTSNVFVIRGSRLITPPPETGILPGITRARVLKIASRAGLRPRERRIGASDLKSADEAFLTASTMEIVPIRAVGRERIGGGTFPRVRQLQVLFRASV